MREPLDWLTGPVAAVDEAARSEAERHQARLTKPPGSLGRLETLAVDFAGFQGRANPQLENIRVRVFAADHGVAARGTSAFPQAVTAQMLENFAAGGAAISVLSRQLGADFAAVNMGCVVPVAECPDLIDCSIGAGTADFTGGPAMSEAQLAQALAAGREQSSAADLFIGGEMGIGNTTSASALLAAVLGHSPGALTGAGTGVSGEALAQKRALINAGLSFHSSALTTPLVILQRLGGFEIAALVGATIACAQKGTPVLVDGFISTAAAAVALAINPGIRPWLVFSHQSHEAGHRLALEALDVRPLLQLDMRLGEGSGAAMAAGVIRQALALHNQMATFATAGVDNAD